GARYRIERPVLELGRLRGAAARELVDGGAERPAAAAGERGVPARGVAAARSIFAITRYILALAGAPPLLQAARTAALVPRPGTGAVARAVAPAILPAVRLSPAALRAVFCAVLPAIVALRLAAVRVARLVAPLLLARAPLVERRAASLALAAV